MSDAGRIALVKIGDFSHINPNVQALLEREFPEFELDVIDVAELPLRGPLRVLSQWAAALAEYGPRAARGRSTLERFARRTPRYFRDVGAAVTRALRGRDYRFTLQTQSMFDARQQGTPNFVYTDHSHKTNLYYPAFDASQLYSARWIELEQTIYRNALVNFTMSSHVSRSLIEHYGCDPASVECVYIGSNVSYPSDSELDDARYASKRILFVGIDWERKGGPLLAKAFAKVLTRISDARLTIIGCSPDVKLANCEVLGRLPLQQVATHYRNAAVFCLPTQIEPFGIVFLEAFAHRLPIVSTGIGALPDILQDGVSGFMVGHADVDALADRLCQLLNAPERCKQFGTAGYRHVRHRYTWEATGKAIAASIRKKLPTAFAISSR